MVLEGHQYQGLSALEESEHNTDAVAVVETYDVYHSPGTIDELNRLLCSCYPELELDSYAVSAPTPPLSPLWNHTFHIIPLRRWRVLKVVVVYFAGIRHELGKNVKRGEGFADNTRQCHALKTFGDCQADKGKQVIGDLINPPCPPESGPPEVMALYTENGAVSFSTKEGNCPFNKLNLTGHNNDLDQDENTEMVSTESNAVKPSKPDSHTGSDKTYSIRELESQGMEFCRNENRLASVLGEPFSHTICGTGDVNNVYAENRHHALENDIRHGKGLLKAKGLTLEDIQNSRASGMKLKDAAVELEDCQADKGKQVINDRPHPACAPESGPPEVIALDTENGMASFDTEEGNCHFNKLNLTGLNNDLDQDENMEMVSTESNAVKPSKPDSHIGFDKTYSIPELEDQGMEFFLNENIWVSFLGEPSSDTICGTGDVNNVCTENRHHALENDIGNSKSLLNLGNWKGKRTSQSKLVKPKGLTLEDIQISRASRKKLKDAAVELKVSPSTLKRRCRDFGIEDWRENKGKSHSPKQPKDGLKHSKEITRTAHNRASEDNEASLGSRIFNIKATHWNSERTIRFDFASTSTLDRLKEEVSKRLNMETSGFKIKYFDEDNEWVEMAFPEDLQLCLRLSSSLGKERIRLQIEDL